MKRYLLAILTALVFLGHARAAGVPERLEFCGMDIRLDGEARKYIDGVVTKLQRSPTYFGTLVDRAEVYFPFVEEAFELAGVPEDLKYIVLQESALRADAVSSSNAVGFWQFKEPAAREVGLMIDRNVDERMHIFRASLGAARYFYRVNRDFDNWIYAIIGYNRGPAGAIPYTDAKYYGAKRMPVTGKTHWYALKAIAHKLAFEPALGQGHPGTWLEPRTTKGGRTVKELAKTAGMDEAEFRRYNAWIRGNRLPDDRDFTFYVKHEGKPVFAKMKHIRDELGGRHIGEPEVKPAQPKPVRQSRNTRRFAYLAPDTDPDHGVEYVQAIEGEKLVEIAVHNDKKIKKLREWNGISLEHRVKAGEVIYLKKPKRRKYHIVRPGETLGSIAAQYEVPRKRLRRKNRMNGDKVFAGQKLYLKRRKPKREKPILLEGLPAPAATPVQQPSPEPESSSGVQKAAEKEDYKLPEVKSSKVIHIVQKGETLWRISKKYGTTVDVIRKMNGLSSNDLYVGQRLRVLKRD